MEGKVNSRLSIEAIKDVWIWLWTWICHHVGWQLLGNGNRWVITQDYGTHPSLAWWPSELIGVTYKNVDKGALTGTWIREHLQERGESKILHHQKASPNTPFGVAESLELSPVLAGSFSREPPSPTSCSLLVCIWGQVPEVLRVLCLSEFPESFKSS